MEVKTVPSALHWKEWVVGCKKKGKFDLLKYTSKERSFLSNVGHLDRCLYVALPKHPRTQIRNLVP